jgi:hypothetical protein
MAKRQKRWESQVTIGSPKQQTEHKVWSKIQEPEAEEARQTTGGAVYTKRYQAAVMVPSVCILIATGGSGCIAGPRTTLPLWAGSKIAPCAGQINFTVFGS